MVGMRNAFAILGILAVIGIVGCGGGGGGAGDGGGGGGGGLPIDGALVGTWQPYAAQVDGAEVGAKAAMDWDQGVVRMTVQFANDGTVTVRYYDADGAVVETENGTWTAQSGVLTVTMPDDTVNLNYQVSGNLITTSAVEEGSQVVIRWVKVVNLTAHEAQLVRSWRVVDIEVNGVPLSVSDYFNVEQDAVTVVFQLLADGTFRAFFVVDLKIADVMEGSWATGGGAMAVTDGDGNVMRGSYIVSNTSVTLLDPAGDTIKMELTPWAPEANHAPALVGTWQAQSVTVNGQTVDMGDFFGWEPTAVSMSVYFYADGTFISAQFDNNGDVVAAEIGTWSTAGNTLTVTADEALPLTYVIAGDTLTLTAEQDGDQVGLTLTRAS